MLVSHQYKFIYLKARKVAGTSVELALAKHCTLPQDVLTRIGKFSPHKDETEYVQHSARNYNDLFNHSPPELVKKKFPSIWKEFTKITIIRNPWDLQVSRYWWQTLGKQPFDKWLGNSHKGNDEYYFDGQGRKYCDVYLRYENLEEEYKALCERLGIPYEVLPRTKTLTRKDRDVKHYREYYTDKTRDLILRENKLFLQHFPYEF